jgi:tRNA-dihydrouridine synthase B
MITIHGRTRDQGYKGQAEYNTIAAIKQALAVPVVANGDIDSPEKARQVLNATGADAVMIGRAAQGRPWIFREIQHFLQTGHHLAAPLIEEVRRLMHEHLKEHVELYGSYTGVRSARKHLIWYSRQWPCAEQFRRQINTLEDPDAQILALDQYLDLLSQTNDRITSENSLPLADTVI